MSQPITFVVLSTGLDNFKEIRKALSAEPRIQLLAFGRQTEETCPSVGAIHATFNQFFFYKLLDEQTCGVTVDV